ncbi:hypothetical protein FQN54_006445 [Arachnomyces sp. PD_36]|nr:hypothetical protein FQN54_006445 [Arachnomyces sp. PD_36]
MSGQQLEGVLMDIIKKYNFEDSNPHIIALLRFARISEMRQWARQDTIMIILKEYKPKRLTNFDLDKFFSFNSKIFLSYAIKQEHKSIIESDESMQIEINISENTLTYIMIVRFCVKLIKANLKIFHYFIEYEYDRHDIYVA